MKWIVFVTKFYKKFQCSQPFAWLFSYIKYAVSNTFLFLNFCFYTLEITFFFLSSAQHQTFGLSLFVTKCHKSYSLHNWIVNSHLSMIHHWKTHCINKCSQLIFTISEQILQETAHYSIYSHLSIAKPLFQSLDSRVSSWRIKTSLIFFFQEITES